MANPWFESIAVAQQRAKRRLPKSVYGALIAGTEAGLTKDDNVAAFSELGLRPITAGQSPERSMETEVMGQHLSMPVIISPTGVQAVHPDGEVAVARAAVARGIPMGLSSFSSKPMDKVMATGAATFFQIYWAGDRDSMVARMERAKVAGAVGILNLPIHQAPNQYDLSNRLIDWLKSGGIPQLGAPNFRVSSNDPVPGFFDAYGTWMSTPPPSWDDVAWLRAQWDGPFMVKGINRADEARKAVDAGASAISVSTHGGNNLDGTPAPIRCLPEVVAAVGDQVEVVMDSGIRRGSDVVKALALGAKAVMIGRAYLWGLAANGQAGVENVLDVLRMGIDSNLMGMGKSSISELSPDDLVIADGFSPPVRD